MEQNPNPTPSYTRLSWDGSGERFYETGVKNAVLYLLDDDGKYTKAHAWNGISGITESPSGAEANAIYADDMKYLNLYSAEEFGFTIEAYYYPDAWGECDGSAEPVAGMQFGQQERKMFGLCYRTTIGNDTEGNDKGFKLHLIYGAKASPSERGYTSINDSPEAITFSWECSTIPVNVTDINNKAFKPVSLITIDSTKVDSDKLNDLMDALYGVTTTTGEEGSAAYLPTPNEVYSILAGTNDSD